MVVALSGSSGGGGRRRRHCGRTQCLASAAAAAATAATAAAAAAAAPMVILVINVITPTFKTSGDVWRMRWRRSCVWHWSGWSWSDIQRILSFLCVCVCVLSFYILFSSIKKDFKNIMYFLNLIFNSESFIYSKKVLFKTLKKCCIIKREF